ncbi:MAG: TRAP transporter small permease [Desulfobacterales bacterium]|jgi:TRAP-type C4-dicarboxylate transport system permease small subunit
MLFFKKSIKLLSSFLNFFAAAALTAIIVLTCLDVFMRYFFNQPIAATYDLVSLMGAVIAAFAMPYTMLMRGHVAVDLIVRRLSRKKKLAIETLTHLVGIFLFLIMVWQCYVLASDMKAAGEVMPTILLPFYPIVYAMSVCFFVLCLAILVDLFNIWLEKVK